MVDENCKIVLIHDGARPFISEKIIDEGIKYANIYGAAAPGVTPKDTIKIKNEDNISVDTPDRNTLVAVQTPQCFKYDEIYQDKYDINGYIKKADDIMNTEECKKAQEKLYGELQQRALDSLSPKEQKAIGKRGGRLYNILNEVMKKYMKWDFKKNCPVE